MASHKQLPDHVMLHLRDMLEDREAPYDMTSMRAWVALSDTLIGFRTIQSSADIVTLPCGVSCNTAAAVAHQHTICIRCIDSCLRALTEFAGVKNTAAFHGQWADDVPTVPTPAVKAVIMDTLGKLMRQEATGRSGPPSSSSDCTDAACSGCSGHSHGAVQAWGTAAATAAKPEPVSTVLGAQGGTAVPRAQLLAELLGHLEASAAILGQLGTLASQYGLGTTDAGTSTAASGAVAGHVLSLDVPTLARALELSTDVVKGTGQLLARASGARQ